MNAKLLIMACSLGAAFPILAADSTNAVVSAAVEVKKPVVHVAQPLKSEAKDTSKITRVENISSRPWAQTVGYHQGEFASDAERYHEPQFTLLWIGKEPSAWKLDR